MWELKKALERQQHVHHLLAVARLLDVGDLAAATIGDAGLRDLRTVDCVVTLDVLGTNVPSSFFSYCMNTSFQISSQLGSSVAGLLPGGGNSVGPTQKNISLSGPQR